MSAFDSPFIIPVAGIAIGAIAIIAGTVNQMQARQVKALQRSEMLARGFSAAEIERLSTGGASAEASIAGPRDPHRSMANARRAGLILSSSGIGIILFFVGVFSILGERDVLCGAAAGLVPLAIGVGFFVDYHLQKRELSRFHLEMEPGVR